MGQGPIFCCPLCKQVLASHGTSLVCEACDRVYEIVNGNVDFFVAEGKYAIGAEDQNRKWLNAEVMAGRDLYYRHCTRKLKGMTFAMEEVGKRTFAGCRILEVGMGTGHFTGWLAEVSPADTQVYAFDFSFASIDQAQANTQGCSGITCFRANARGPLPFKDGTFDIVWVRLAPLSPKGSTKGASDRRALALLKPGGWYFAAGWKEEWCSVEDLIEYGYTNVEHHRWQYPYVYGDEEHLGLELEAGRSPEEAKALIEERKQEQNRSDGWESLKGEHLLIAQKPVS